MYISRRFWIFEFWIIFSVFQNIQVVGYSWSTRLWYCCYYPHQSRDALSPVCRFFYFNFYFFSIINSFPKCFYTFQVIVFFFNKRYKDIKHIKLNTFSRQNRKFGESCVFNGLLVVCGTAQFPSTLRKFSKTPKQNI